MNSQPFLASPRSRDRRPSTLSVEESWREELLSPDARSSNPFNSASLEGISILSVVLFGSEFSRLVVSREIGYSKKALPDPEAF